MKTIELELDEQTFERAQRVAGARRSSLETLITEIIRQLALLEARHDPLLGMFAHEPDVMDQVMATVMTARESHPWRSDHG